jgi:hypothetical protein
MKLNNFAALCGNKLRGAIRKAALAGAGVAVTASSALAIVNCTVSTDCGIMDNLYWFVAQYFFYIMLAVIAIILLVVYNYTK